LTDAEQVRDRVAVDISVEDPDAVALLGQRDREARRHRRLADAALPGAHRKNARRRVKREPLRASADRAAQLLSQCLPLLRRHHVEAEVDFIDAVERRDLAPHLILEARAKGAAGDRQRDRDDDLAAVDLHGPHHVQLCDRALELGVDHAAEGFENGFATGHLPRDYRSRSSAKPHRNSVAVPIAGGR
jgi:hypothetical protein